MRESTADRNQCVEDAKRLAEAGELPFRYVVGSEGADDELERFVLEARAGRVRLLGKGGPVFDTSSAGVEKVKFPLTKSTSTIRLRVDEQDHDLQVMAYVPGEGLGYTEDPDGSIRFNDEAPGVEWGECLLFALDQRAERIAWKRVLTGQSSAEEAAAERLPVYTERLEAGELEGAD